MKNTKYIFMAVSLYSILRNCISKIYNVFPKNCSTILKIVLLLDIGIWVFFCH